MAIGDAMVAPAGLQNQMYGQPTRVPGYDRGLSQAPGQMALPPEPMPIGRPTAVVGGPAYFTPQGYQAPPQPTEAFMPTDRRPDPIGQQFMRQMESPMGQQFQQQYEATQAPIREAEMARRAEEQAAQDARFQEMMDRIAELEGQLATPEPAPMPDLEPFVPGGPFLGIPDFIRDLDFRGLPNFDIDYDDLMDQYRDREPNDRETDARNAAQIRSDAIRRNRERVEEPIFTNMPVLDGPRGPGMSIGDMLEGRVTRMPVGNPVEAPVMKKVFAEGPTKRIDNTLPDFLEKYRNSPESIKNFTAPIPPAMVPNIPNIPNIDFSNLPKFEMPEIGKPAMGGRPMIPSFGNFNLR
jgi:hypothetical protein